VGVRRALTEEQHEEKQADEADSLLEVTCMPVMFCGGCTVTSSVGVHQFVDSLDFESYVDDVEVRAALEAARQRITQLSERDSDEESDHDEGDADAPKPSDGVGKSESKAYGRPAAALTEAALKKVSLCVLWLFFTCFLWFTLRICFPQHNLKQTADPSGSGGDDTKSLADTVMTSASSIKQIHSKKSLAAVIDKMKKEGETLSAIPEEPAHVAALPKVTPPVVSVVDDSAAALAEKKKLVSQLAFLNRNPAI
jgi:hypothetical protein